MLARYLYFPPFAVAEDEGRVNRSHPGLVIPLGLFASTTSYPMYRKCAPPTQQFIFRPDSEALGGSEDRRAHTTAVSMFTALANRLPCEIGEFLYAWAHPR